jgi:hypothetical protein
MRPISVRSQSISHNSIQLRAESVGYIQKQIAIEENEQEDVQTFHNNNIGTVTASMGASSTSKKEENRLAILIMLSIALVWTLYGNIAVFYP